MTPGSAKWWLTTFVVAGVLLTVIRLSVTFHALGTSDLRPRSDGVAVEKALREGTFGDLRPGDIATLRADLRPSDRFFVVGPRSSDGFGDNVVANARLLLGSALLPNVMVVNARAADVVIRIGQSPALRGEVTRIRPGVELIRLGA